MLCESGFSKIWIFGYAETAPRHIITFQFRNKTQTEQIDICVNVFNISAIPALFVWCSLPSGNPKSGFWLCVNGITSVRGDSLDRISRKFTHGFIWELKNILNVSHGNSLFVFGMDPCGELPENSVMGSPLAEADSVSEFPGNASMDSKYTVKTVMFLRNPIN